MVEVHSGITGGAGTLPVCRKKGILESVHQGLGRYPLLLLEGANGVNDLLTHLDAPFPLFGTRLDRSMLSNGILIN